MSFVMVCGVQHHCTMAAVRHIVSMHRALNFAGSSYRLLPGELTPQERPKIAHKDHACM